MLNRILAAILLAIPLCAVAQAQDKPTYAERLGYPKGARVVLFHCDDGGMCHEQNLGAMKSLEYGVLTSVSTMMPCPWVPEMAAYLKEHPNVDNGLHLTLTSEWKNYRWAPLAGKAAVPGLVDPEGCLWPSVKDVVEHATAAEVETELRAQIDRAQTLGMPITHLDTHMGTVYATPEFLGVYIKLGIEKQIPIMIMGGHIQYTAEDEPDAAKALMAQGIAEKVWEGGLPVLDDLLNRTYGWKTFSEKKQNLLDSLRNMKPGLTMVIFHCAVPNEVWPLFTSSSETRLNDLRVTTDPEVKKFLEDNGFILTTWRELMERRKKAK